MSASGPLDTTFKTTVSSGSTQAGYVTEGLGQARYRDCERDLTW